MIYDGGFAERGDEGLPLAGPHRCDLPRKQASRCAAPIAWAFSARPGATRPICRKYATRPGLAGNVGIISQSGGFCVSLLTDVSRFGFSHIVSCGNEAVLDAADFLEYLIDDPQTAVIGGFIETSASSGACRRGARPRRRMRQAGRADQGRAHAAQPPRAVWTHTAGEAGGPEGISELLAMHRAIEVADLAELTEVLAASQGATPAGRAADWRDHLVGRCSPS